MKASYILTILLASTVVSRGDLRLDLVTGGLSDPLFVTAPPGDTNRLFILEQHTGRIRIFDWETASLRTTPFITVPNLSTGGEQGLLGLAFHPNYRSNGFFYVDITAQDRAGATEILRYTATGDPATAQTASPASEKLILTFTQPQVNHNGGWIGFGADGFLYIATGDGGGANDQHGSIGNAQDRSVLLGKILRIDVDGADPYAIPDGNPFKGNDSTFREEIWAFGLRNPWRCSFDRETGDLWIGDVGQGAREEIDLIPAGVGGLNFGWRPREGTIHTPAIASSEQPVTPAIEPLFDYTHSFGISVTGGYLYRGNKVSELRGKYIFADYGSARFWRLTPDGTNGVTEEITLEINSPNKPVANPSSFGEDASGELYVCDYSGGQIYRIAGTVAPPTLMAAALSGGMIVLRFDALSGTEYALQSRGSLSPSDSWMTLTNFPAPAADSSLAMTNAVTGAQQYFRVLVP